MHGTTWATSRACTRRWSTSGALRRLGHGPYLLVESPLNPAVGDFEWMIDRLFSEHRIALAHPERCPTFQRNPERLIRLVSKGAICSVTAGAIRGDFGRDVKRFTAWL